MHTCIWKASICASFDQLRPNEKLKPYYGEQPHKMISILILSFRYTFYVGLMNLMSSGILIVKRIILAITYILATHMKA